MASFSLKTVQVFALLFSFLVVASRAQSIALERVTSLNTHVTPIRVRATGRTQLSSEGTYTYQWPGIYFTASYRGSAFYFNSGSGKQHLRLSVDGKSTDAVLDPDPATYRVITPAGTHTLRIDILNENQDSPKSLGSFGVPTGPESKGIPPSAAFQIEAIGDSHTVGYGNASPSSTCTSDEVWSTTDPTRSPGALVAARLHADYQINAISGRGVVRNYNNVPGLTVPEAYSYSLLDRASPRYSDPAWKPSVLLISLGTNDFSTDLHGGEPWQTRADLHTAFENTYAAFVRSLRAAHPRALILLWSTDMAHGEIAAEGRRVADNLRASGDPRVSFIEVSGLTFHGCHGHPTVADDQAIANKLIAAIDAKSGAATKQIERSNVRD